jgi:hypothetical protein
MPVLTVPENAHDLSLYLSLEILSRIVSLSPNIFLLGGDPESMMSSQTKP